MTTEISRNKEIDPTTKSLLDIYRALCRGRRLIDVGSPFGEMDPSIVVSAVRWGTKRGDVKFEWVSGDNTFREPTVSVLSDGSKKVIQVTVGETHKKELEKEIGKIIPTGSLPYFWYQREYVIESLLKIGEEKRKGLGVWQVVEKTMITIYRYYRVL